MTTPAVRRIIVTLAAVAIVLSTSRARAEDEKQEKPWQPHLSLSALMTFGSFVSVPVMRGGVAVEGRTRHLSAHAILALGRTPNGLGAHRIEVGASLTSPMAWFRASIGPHVGYAMLVRATEQNAFVNALLGDVGSVTIGAHAAIEVSMELSDQTRLFVAGRAMGEIYQVGTGWELGPTMGLHF